MSPAKCFSSLPCECRGGLGRGAVVSRDASEENPLLQRHPLPTSPCFRRGRSKARGFTLIEVLLATVLLAAGLALAFATLRAATATSQRGELIAQRSERMRAVEGFLRRRIASALPIGFGIDETTGTPLRFIGERDRMRFVADLPDYLGRGGPHLHDVRIVDSTDGSGRNGARLVVSLPMVLAGEVVEDRDARPPETLVPDLREARFRYRGLDDQNQLGDWLDEWGATDRLPLQVRIDIQSADGMVWPMLVVALPQSASAGGTGEFR